MLKTETLEYLREEAEKAGVKKMILFGSCLRKNEDEAGDIDLAVDGISGWKLNVFHGGLMVDLRKNIDVVDLSFDLPILHIIDEDGVVIYEREE